MKGLLTFLLGVALFIADSSVLALPQGQTNNVYAKLSGMRAVGDVRGIIKLLPEIETLWSADADWYFPSMKEAASALELAAPTNPQARSALLMLFSNAMQKSCSSKNKDQIDCLEAKWNTAMNSISAVGESGQKSILLQLARFVGEVRAQVVSNYTNKVYLHPPAAEAILQKAGVRHPNSLKDPALKEAYEKAIRENDQNAQTERYQSLLSRIDQTISPRLLQFCERFSANEPSNKEFLTQVASAARLTNEERSRL
jgi:hypothetical protein